MDQYTNAGFWPPKGEHHNLQDVQPLVAIWQHHLITHAIRHSPFGLPCLWDGRFIWVLARGNGRLLERNTQDIWCARKRETWRLACEFDGVEKTSFEAPWIAHTSENCVLVLSICFDWRVYLHLCIFFGFMDVQFQSGFWVVWFLHGSKFRTCSFPVRVKWTFWMPCHFSKHTI